MRAIRSVPVVLAASLALVGVAAAGSGGGQKLKPFGDADVTITNHNDVTISVGPGEYGGVEHGKASTGTMSKAHYSFTSRGDVQGGAPRFSIPIDTDGNRDTVEGYAFLDAANCGGVVGDNPTGVKTVVSTDREACLVFYGPGTYANWDAFADANPSYRVAKAIPFVIADVQGEYDLRAVQFGAK